MGKTVFTALLLLHLRLNNVKAVALKPFCSGDRKDVELLQSIQPGELSIDEVNPYFYSQPVAPLTAAKGKLKRLSLKQIRKKIELVAEKADLLLIEGAGGVLVPVSKNLSIADVISDLKCEVFLVSRNKLGTLNHTLLSVEALKKRGIKRITIILMDTEKLDLSSRTNETILASLLPKNSIFRIPWISEKPNKIKVLTAMEKKFKKTLARTVLHH